MLLGEKLQNFITCSEGNRIIHILVLWKPLENEDKIHKENLSFQLKATVEKLAQLHVY
jgi:hypothetical protein